MKTRHLFTLLGFVLMLMLITSCSTATPTNTSVKPLMSSTPAATSSAPATSTQALTSVAPSTTKAEPGKPQGELVAALQTFGFGNFLPWADPDSAPMQNIVYDMLIYYDYVNFKFLPGLAESWEVSQDGLTLTYHLRKGIQFSGGWGELTSADVKYNFEMQASPKSAGKTAQCRRIASMDTPDLYTLVVHFKGPYPTFWVDLSAGNSGICQGIVSKKYLDTVGQTEASKKPIGTGPYKLVDFQSGSFFKFEALENHWRVIPEFKTLTLRNVPEISTTIAMLKNKEIDMASVPVEQLADLQSAGIAVEASPVGGNSLMVRWGGMVINEDSRFDQSYHNQDPWKDVRVRKAMAISIDREAICKEIFAGFAKPTGVPLYKKDENKYQYSYDPNAARQLLKDAGYSNGFSFKFISYTIPGIPQTTRIVEALASYWKQIGLDPKITIVDYDTYNSKNVKTLKTAGELSLGAFPPIADMLSIVDSHFAPNAVNVLFEDEGSYALYLDKPEATFEQRLACVDKLNQYYYENVGPIPLGRVGTGFAWNSNKILAWPHGESPAPIYFEYVRHAQPVNTFRLFSPWPDR